MRSGASLLALLAGIAVTTAIPTLRARDDDAAIDQILNDAGLTAYVAPALNRDITEWIALGDSFAAGISADVPADEVNYACSRFKKSYPSQMNENPRFPGYSTSRVFTFNACTGATIEDVRTKQVEFSSPPSNFAAIGTPQIGTVSISGNDLKFGDIVNGCLYHWTGYGDCATLLKSAHDTIDQAGNVFFLKIFDILTHLLVRGRGANPSFQLYVTGYIRFWNDENTQCDGASWTTWPREKAYLTTTLRKDMNGLVLKLNNVLRSAAEALNGREGGVYFVDEFESRFDGHRFCEVEQDTSYHDKPIDDRTWFIHYQSPYVNPSSVTGLGDGSFFDQVDAILIPPKDGKSTSDQILEVDGDRSKLNSAYESVDTMTAALNQLANDDSALSILPVTWIRMMHPKGFGYAAMSDAVIDKVLEFGAAGADGDDSGDNSGSDEPEQGLQCFGVDTNTFIGRDDMNDKIGQFCADAAAQKVQDQDSGSTVRKYNEGTRYEVDISMDWPSGLDISDGMEDKCKEKMTLIMDSCDGNDPSNPLNWKHGGTLGDGSVRYGIYPKIDQGYRPGSCSFHMREDESWTGVDGPGTSRTWYFSIEQLRMLDNEKNEIGRAGFKENSGDGEAIDCGDANPYSWETKLPDYLRITPEAQGDYVQFDIGSRSWTTDNHDGDMQCSVGGWSGDYSPIHRDMDCAFPC